MGRGDPRIAHDSPRRTPDYCHAAETLGVDT